MMTDNPYPVDSTYHPCCHAIGRHRRECQTSVTNTPPQQTLDDAVNRVDVIRADLNVVLRSLSRDVPLFAVVDLVTSLGHLRQAAVLVDRVADVLEAEKGRR